MAAEDLTMPTLEEVDDSVSPARLPFVVAAEELGSHEVVLGNGPASRASRISTWGLARAIDTLAGAQDALEPQLATNIVRISAVLGKIRENYEESGVQVADLEVAHFLSDPEHYVAARRAVYAALDHSYTHRI